MFDSEGNGMGGWFGNGYFRVYQERGDGDVLLAEGDHRFEETSTVFFSVACDRSTDIPDEGGKDQDESTCKDQDGLVVKVSDDVDETCWFLSDSDQHGYLCDWIDVALACPATCGICPDLENIECGADKEGDIRLDDSVGHKSCAYLSDTLGRFGFACQRTDVALHCPVTCGLQTCTS